MYAVSAVQLCALHKDGNKVHVWKSRATKLVHDIPSTSKCRETCPLSTRGSAAMDWTTSMDWLAYENLLTTHHSLSGLLTNLDWLMTLLCSVCRMLKWSSAFSVGLLEILEAILV